MKEFTTRVGQLQCPVGSEEKWCAELLLEGLDLVADRRLGDEQFLRRTREAQMARGGAKSSQQVE
ncbi:MAG TPA: hypothetical protein PLW72_01225 [Burkholderiaceae bacterium]|nr:hypothetical protein [Burkholderiaceae bacterium]